MFACAAVVGTHLACARLGNARLVVDAVVYVALVLGSGAVPLRDLAGLAGFVRSNLRRRAG
jgi:hypothetical protein